MRETEGETERKKEKKDILTSSKAKKKCRRRTKGWVGPHPLAQRGGLVSRELGLCDVRER